MLVPAALVLAALLTAATAPAPATPPSLAASVGAEVGKGGPVALVGGPEGLVALSADGARKKVVLAEPLLWAWPDARAQVVWVQRKSDLTRVAMLDLTRPEAALEPALEGLPVADALAFEVIHPGPPSERVGSGSWHAAKLVLRLDGRAPAIAADAGLLVNWEDQEKAFVDTIKKVRFAKGAKARLAALIKRGAARRVEPAARPKAAKLPRVKVPGETCEEPEECGVAQPVLGTPYWLVTVAYSCGDGCYTEREFYDPKAQQFFDPMRPGKRSATPLLDAGVDDLRVSADGAAYVTMGRVIRFAGGVVRLGSEGGGWLGGGWRIR